MSTPTPTPTPTPDPTAQWYDGLDADTKGYLQNKGLDKKTPVEAVAEVAKFHREAEKFVGAPANELVRLPKDPASPDWKAVHERLGKPVEAKDYDFSTVKRAGDKPLDQALTDTLRQAAFDSNVSKADAARLAAAFVKYLDGNESTAAAIAADTLVVQKKLLKDNWGNNEAANMVVAQGAVKALGVDPEAVAALEKVVGYAKVMDMFRNIGSKISEDRFVNSQTPGGGVMTKEQAMDEKKALMADKEWGKRYNAGGVEEKRKMLALNTIISAGS